MYVSDEKRCVFVHIQKTGGISVEKFLRQHAPDLRLVGGRHEHLGRMPAELLHSWDHYFKFCFVRNPWDRLVSWHSMIRREYYRLPKWQRLLKKRPLRREIWNLALPYLNQFDRFVEECTEEVFDGDCVKSFAYNQFDYIRGPDGGCGVDFVGRFEDFAKDMNHVLSHLGFGEIEFPHENRSRHDHYTHYYDEKSRAIVEKRFQCDIQRFGYSYGD